MYILIHMYIKVSIIICKGQDIDMIELVSILMPHSAVYIISHMWRDFLTVIPQQL
jgi:hypothetical protein